MVSGCFKMLKNQERRTKIKTTSSNFHFQVHCAKLNKNVKCLKEDREIFEWLLPGVSGVTTFCLYLNHMGIELRY